MNLLKLLLPILLIANNAEAFDVKLLNKGDAAPYKGILFTISSSKDLQTQLDNCKKIEGLNLSLNASIDIYRKNEVIFNEEVTQLTSQNHDLVKAVVDASENSMWTKVLYFGLGLVAGGLVGYAVTR